MSDALVRGTAGPTRPQRVGGGAAHPWRRLLTRPELGAAVAAIALILLFGVVANNWWQASSAATVLYGSSTIGIMAVSISLLMIGGEFDLSAGVAVTTAALTASIFSYQLSTNVWVGVVVSLVLALAIGAFNGWLLVVTKLPSFIVTLGTFFALTGLNLGVTRAVTGGVATTSISDIDGFSSARAVFGSQPSIFGTNVYITVFWWIGFALLASWVLQRTRVGNWIFAVGGNGPSARAVGIPVTRVKIGLYMAVGFTAWFSGMHLLFAYDAVQSGEGVGNEFIYIIAAVVGGCLLTGGFGSAIGGAIGALIYGIADKGIVYANWNPDWEKLFLGILVLAATMINLLVRRRAQERR